MLMFFVTDSANNRITLPPGVNTMDLAVEHAATLAAAFGGAYSVYSIVKVAQVSA